MRVTNRGAKEPIRDRVNFNANSMSGRWTNDADFGRMENTTGRNLFTSMMREHLRQSETMFVVYSYATPIAWYSPLQERWYYVNEKYSPTTTQHQRIVRMAIDTWDGESWAHDYVEVS